LKILADFTVGAGDTDIWLLLRNALHACNEFLNQAWREQSQHVPARVVRRLVERLLFMPWRDAEFFEIGD
jgi:hypothetical protein